MSDEDRAPARGVQLANRTVRRLTWAGGISNGVGALIVFLFFIYVAPSQLTDSEFSGVLRRGIPAFVVYMAITLPFGRYWAARLPFRPIEKWLAADRPATDDERRIVLRYPLVWALRSGVIWGVGAVLFAALNATLGVVNMLGVATTAALGGVTACALQYLVVERIMRPVTARALDGGAPPAHASPGVSMRLTTTWALATGVPVLGVAGFAVVDLVGVHVDESRLLGGILVLAAVAVVAGLSAMVFGARSVADPLGDLTRALEQVEHGDLGVRVAVNDGSEVGLVQAGFNRMVEGLVERDRIREAFGTYLDPDVADHILREGTALEGEEVDVTAMFVDIRDFTGFAERESAPVVVATLNRLFEELVPVIHGHGGHIDKFVGDGFLAVFGAPQRQRDHADQALAAAIEISRRVGERMGERLSVGIGLNTGPVVAGNVGGDGRFDFSVIGDVINVAARVEAATRQTGDLVLVSEHTARSLRDGGPDLEPRPDVRLKGKRDAVMVYSPVNAPAPAGSTTPS